MSWTCSKCQTVNELNSVYCDNCGDAYHMPVATEVKSEVKVENNITIHQESNLQKYIKIAVFVFIVIATALIASNLNKTNTEDKSNSPQSDATLSVNIINIIKSETGFLDYQVNQKEDSMNVTILATNLATQESAKNISKQVLNEIQKFYPHKKINITTKTFEGKVLAAINN